MAKSVPFRDSAPLIMRRFDPTPSISAPIWMSILQRSCTCGSQAAFIIIVVPSARDAAIIAFSVPVTDASSRKTGTPTSLVAEKVSVFSREIRAPSSWSATICVSILLRPIVSPPGGGRIALPKRATRGPANRIEARTFLASSSGTSYLEIGRGSKHQLLASTCSTKPPR